MTLDEFCIVLTFCHAAPDSNRCKNAVEGANGSGPSHPWSNQPRRSQTLHVNNSISDLQSGSWLGTEWKSPWEHFLLRQSNNTCFIPFVALFLQNWPTVPSSLEVKISSMLFMSRILDAFFTLISLSLRPHCQFFHTCISSFCSHPWKFLLLFQHLAIVFKCQPSKRRSFWRHIEGIAWYQPLTIEELFLPSCYAMVNDFSSIMLQTPLPQEGALE